MKKFISIFLILILFFQTGGIIILLKSQLWYVRKEVKTSLNSSKTLFEKMTLSVEELEKCKVNEKEFLYHGCMYDIKSLIIHDSLVELTVINDTKEKKIIDRLSNFTQHNHESKRDFTTQLFHFLFLNYLPQLVQFKMNGVEQQVLLNFQYRLNLQSPFQSIVTPPPQDL